MTCRELQACFEESVPAAFDSWISRVEIAEHILNCASCGGFVEAQRELAKSLAFVREAVPRFPQPVDSAVLAHFRKRRASTSSAVTSPSLRSYLHMPVIWGAALAMVVATSVVFFSSRKIVSTTIQPRAEVPVTTQTTERTVASAVPAARRKEPRPVLIPTAKKNGTVSPAFASGALPAGFHSLMYCDELSCAGTMEMIRVQLPPSAFASETAAANEAVFADVLVGPDGIARGIRIVE